MMFLLELIVSLMTYQQILNMKTVIFLLQLMAECTYAAMYAMRDPKGMTPQKMFPELFKVEDDSAPAPEITEQDAKDLQDLMANYKW